MRLQQDFTNIFLDNTLHANIICLCCTDEQDTEISQTSVSGELVRVTPYACLCGWSINGFQKCTVSHMCELDYVSK